MQDIIITTSHCRFANLGSIYNMEAVTGTFCVYMNNFLLDLPLWTCGPALSLPFFPSDEVSRAFVFFMARLTTGICLLILFLPCISQAAGGYEVTGKNLACHILWYMSALWCMPVYNRKMCTAMLLYCNQVVGRGRSIKLSHIKLVIEVTWKERSERSLSLSLSLLNLDARVASCLWNLSFLLRKLPRRSGQRPVPAVYTWQIFQDNFTPGYRNS